MTEEQLQKRREANAARMRAWREANPELAKERMRAFEAKNREKRIAYKAKLRAANPEHSKAKSREASAKRRAENPEAVAAYRAEWLEREGIREKRRAYESQRDKRLRAEAAVAREKIPPAPLSDDPKKVAKRAYMKAWREKNIAKVREQKRIWNNNRDRKCKVPGKLTLAEWRGIVSNQNGLCFDCGERRRMTIGHLVPLCKGGSHKAENIVAQCMPCNQKQGTKIHSSVSG